MDDNFKKRLRELIRYFSNDPQVKFTPYPEYDPEVNEALTLLGDDMNYMENYEKLSGIEMSDVDIDAIRTIFMYIRRGERVYDGHIAGYIQNGLILNLLLRLQFLIGDAPKKRKKSGKLSFDADSSALDKIPHTEGVYKVFIPADKTRISLVLPEFKDGSKLDMAAVKSKYKETAGEKLIYIGKAADLQKSIRQFIDYGNAKSSVHKTGRYVFAIKGWKKLEIRYTEAEDCKALEKKELDSFKKKHSGFKPFANM